MEIIPPENTSNNDDDKTIDLDLKALDVDSISESISELRDKRNGLHQAITKKGSIN